MLPLFFLSYIYIYTYIYRSEEEPMVKDDGAGQSRTKAVTVSGTITAAKTKIVMKSIPNRDSPGRMEVQCSMSSTGNISIVRAGLLGNMLLATLWLL